MMKARGRLFLKICSVLCMFLAASCRQKEPEAVMILPPFSITNEVVGDQVRQVFYTTNGISLYFTRSDVVVWFGDSSSTSVEFDSETRKPLNILLRKEAASGQPAELVLDVNADGVPEIRRVAGNDKNQIVYSILYQGEWYTKQRNKGSNSVITIEGNEVEVRFDGRRFMRVPTERDVP